MSFDHPPLSVSSGLTAFVFAGGGSLGAIESACCASCSTGACVRIA